SRARPPGPGARRSTRCPGRPAAPPPPGGGSAPESTSAAGSRESAAWIVARSPSRPFRSWSGRRAGPSSVAADGRPPPGGQGRLFTITDLRVHHADLGVHDGPILLFTLRRSGCSRWTDLGVHHGPKPAVWSRAMAEAEGDRHGPTAKWDAPPRGIALV